MTQQEQKELIEALNQKWRIDDVLKHITLAIEMLERISIKPDEYNKMRRRKDACYNLEQAKKSIFNIEV